MSKLKCIPYKDVVVLDSKLQDVISSHFNLSSGKATLTEDDLNYLIGVKDAGIADTSKLINLLTQHKKIELYIE